MADRTKSRVLDVVAHGLGPPCLAAAFLLYFVVTWTPTSFPVKGRANGTTSGSGKRDHLVGASADARACRNRARWARGTDAASGRGGGVLEAAIAESGDGTLTRIVMR
jgi:hypothetical protein